MTAGRLRTPAMGLALVLLIGWLGARPASADGVRAETVFGRKLTGPTATISADGRLELGGTKVACDEVAVIEFHQPAPAKPTGLFVRLRDGGRLLAEAEKGERQTLRLKVPGVDGITVNLDHVSAIGFTSDRTPAPADKEQDQLHLRTRDVLTGRLEAVGPKGLSFSCELGRVDVPFARARLLVLAGDRTLLPPKELYVRVHLRNGSLLIGRIEQLDQRGLVLKSRTVGLAAAIPLPAIQRIEFRNGRMVFLSDLEPVTVEEVPYFNRVWPYRRDRSVGGGPLTLAGKVYAKGLGVHSRCTLTFDLGGAFQEFRSDIGIDDEVGRRGHVSFQVTADGRTLFPVTPADGQMTGASPTRSLRLAVKGVQRLTLRVDFGQEFDVADHADWAEARLLK